MLVIITLATLILHLAQSSNVTEDSVQPNDNPLNDFVDKWLSSAEIMFTKLEGNQTWDQPIAIPLDQMMEMADTLTAMFGSISKDVSYIAKYEGYFDYAKGFLCDCPNVYRDFL